MTQNKNDSKSDISYGDKEMFSFPRSLPNDVEGFAIFYPKKFPAVIPLFESLAKKYFKKPDEFKKFIYDEQKELFAGFAKIEKEYNAKKEKTMDFVVRTDERLHKLFCFKFWIVNYGFCDGPVHDYYVEQLRHYAEKVAEWEHIEEKEKAVLALERDLLQGDYADLYLQITFGGIHVYHALNKSKKLSSLVEKFKKTLKMHDNNMMYASVEDRLKIILYDKSKEIQEIHKLLEIPISVAKVKGTNFALYQAIIHSFEFYEKNVELKKRYDDTVARIHHTFDVAKKVLSKEQFEDMSVCYRMCNLFKEAKDVFGELDSDIIPLWFKMLGKLSDDLKIPPDIVIIGHAAMFYLHVWYLPPELKARVFTPDITSFDLKKL